jgi:hypothetical protein
MSKSENLHVIILASGEDHSLKSLTQALTGVDTPKQFALIAGTSISSHGLIEVVGARLANPACDALPTDPNDPRLVDDDNDGLPGITIGLKGLISGTLQCVQRQATALHGVVVAADRVEGGMVYESEQSVVESEPADLKSLYELSTSSTDPTACSSSFVMVKVPDATDAGVVDCDWVRDNEVALLGM